MLNEFNLLISTSRGNENKACAEIWFLLGEIGDENARVEKTGISGLVALRTFLDPFKVIGNLRNLLREKPEEFRYTLKVVPIEVVIRTRLEEISQATTGLASKIADGETFRITIEKRYTEIASTAIIGAIAEKINRKVNLDEPDKIVLVEILGGTTGMSVIKDNDILSVVKEKRLG